MAGEERYCPPSRAGPSPAFNTSVMTNAREAQIDNYGHALRRFAEWFNRFRKPDGSFDAPNLSCPAYMPVPLYAHATGDTDLLHRTLAYIEARAERDAHFLRAPGKGLLPYRMAWIAMGAMLGDRLRLARSLEQQMLRFQDGRTGGFFGTEAAERAGEGEICFDSTANVCAALCVVGNDTAAARAGDFLRRLVEPQLHAGGRLLCGWHSERGLMTEFNPKEVLTYAIEQGQPAQYLYKIGLLVRAFTILYGRTGDAADLSLARACQQWAVGGAPDVWSNTLGHKLGWSAWTLFTVTREEEYVAQACRVADHLTGLQQPDGAFHYPEFWPPYPQVQLESKINLGCQFATWIAYAQTMLRGSD
jgi:hypothetical protein